MTGKKYRVVTLVTKKMYEWIDKQRPKHMSKSCTLEHYFWLGIEYERLQNRHMNSTPT